MGQKLLFSHGKIGRSQEVLSELRALTVSECIWQPPSFTPRSFQISARWPPKLLSLQSRNKGRVSANKQRVGKEGGRMGTSLLPWLKCFGLKVPLFEMNSGIVPSASTLRGCIVWYKSSPYSTPQGHIYRKYTYTITGSRWLA